MDCRDHHFDYTTRSINFLYSRGLFKRKRPPTRGRFFSVHNNFRLSLLKVMTLCLFVQQKPAQVNGLDKAKARK